MNPLLKALLEGLGLPRPPLPNKAYPPWPH